MAYKNIFTKRFLPFHEKAAKIPWKEVSLPLRTVMLSMLRLSGLGFLVNAILLIAYPVVKYSSPHSVYIFIIPSIALIYCI
jgi:hypothetical protein